MRYGSKCNPKLPETWISTEKNMGDAKEVSLAMNGIGMDI